MSKIIDEKEIRHCPKCGETGFLLRWHVGDWLVECINCEERVWLEDISRDV